MTKKVKLVKKTLLKCKRSNKNNDDLKPSKRNPRNPHSDEAPIADRGKVSEPVGMHRKTGRPGKNSGYAEDQPSIRKKLKKKIAK